MKNGKSEGTTEFAHNDRPVLAADKLEFENITSDIVNKIKIIDNRFSFTENNINLKLRLFILKIIL